MPIFQQDLERRESAEELEMPSPPRPFHLETPPAQPSILARKLSEESIRTELCEGPINDSPPTRTPENEAVTPCSDRAELIERLKRGESPTWIPNRHVRESQFPYQNPTE